MRRLAVATVTLVGLGPGLPVMVDTDDPQIMRWVRGGQLRFVDADPQPEIESLVTGLPEPKAEVKPKPRRRVST